MAPKRETILLVSLISLILLNISGILVPLWHIKDHQRDVKNATDVQSCVISVNIQEGLWQRFCYEVEGAVCVEDFEEWCDNLDGQDYLHYVTSLELCGDIFLLAAIAAILRNRMCGHQFTMEMLGTFIGCGGLLMMAGILVFALADGGEIGFEATDLHLGWGLCFGAGALTECLCLCVCCMNQWNSRRHQDFFPITDSFSTHNDSDDDLIEM